MKVCGLQIKNYRNLKDEYIEFGDGLNIIYGENAQGKTNILEAIWLLTGARSFRGVKDTGLVMFEKEKAEIIGKIVFEDRDISIKINISDGKRTAEINGLNRGMATSIIGNFKSVIFYPEHLLLIKGGPEKRRKLIDATICQMKPSYTSILVRYSKTLKNRNSLLKSYFNNLSTQNSLDVWDYKLSEYAGLIVHERIKYIKLLNEKAKRIYKELSLGEALEITYSNQNEVEGANAKEISKMILCELKKSINNDKIRKFTSVGPHRDELYININGRQAKLFGSQGQQRSAVIAIKLAESETVKELTGETPVVLLDDILSELDEKRQRYIFKNNIGAQTIITGCIKPEIKMKDKNKIKTFLVGFYPTKEKGENKDKKESINKKIFLEE